MHSSFTGHDCMRAAGDYPEFNSSDFQVIIYKAFLSQLMLKTIAFDLGGVLFSEAKSYMLEKMGRYGFDRKKVLDILTSKESLDLRKGLMSDEKFWAWAKTNLPENYDTGTISREWQEEYELDEEYLRICS